MQMAWKSKWFNALVQFNLIDDTEVKIGTRVVKTVFFNFVKCQNTIL